MKTTRKTLQLLLFLLFLCSGVHAQSGQWTDEGNYDISWYNPSQTEFRLQTPAQLAGLAYLSQKENVNFAGVHIQLDRDINLSAHYWTPVPQFSGWFDGGGHTLDGLLIRDVTAGGEMGFIAILKSRPIRMTASGVGRLTFGPACRLSGNISGREDAAVGVVAARVEGECLVSDCHFQGTVELTVKDARAYVGGICGDMSGTALGCSHSGRLVLTIEDEGDVDAGGITGRCLSGGVRLTACMNRGRVEANSSSASQRGISLGGIAGTAFSKSILNSCRNAGEVCINSTGPSTSSVLSRAAGLVCCNYGLVINSSNTERVTVNGVRVRAGGICASNHGRIVNSYNTAEVACNGKKDSGFHNKGVENRTMTQKTFVVEEVPDLEMHTIDAKKLEEDERRRKLHQAELRRQRETAQQRETDRPADRVSVAAEEPESRREAPRPRQEVSSREVESSGERRRGRNEVPDVNRWFQRTFGNFFNEDMNKDSEF